jgi:hypothetical protein
MVSRAGERDERQGHTLALVFLVSVFYLLSVCLSSLPPLAVIHSLPHTPCSHSFSTAYSLSLSLTIHILGKNGTLSFPHQRVCRHCHGAGAETSQVSLCVCVFVCVCLAVLSHAQPHNAQFDAHLPSRPRVSPSSPAHLALALALALWLSSRSRSLALSLSRSRLKVAMLCTSHRSVHTAADTDTR